MERPIGEAIHRKAWIFICLSLTLLQGMAIRAEIIDRCVEDIAQARTVEAAKSKGGPEGNRLTNSSEFVRAGQSAFKHWVNRQGERSELAMARTEIGRSYWYGWSMYLPKEFDHTGHFTIVMQLAAYPSPRNGRFPCGGNGHMISVETSGQVVYKMQHAGKDKDSECQTYSLGQASGIKGKWVDFVLSARWSAGADGYLRLWMKIQDNNYLQKIDYSGSTWWTDEDKGPYFKMGAYMGDPDWSGPADRTVYTDEYRLGDARSSFDEVAPPGAEERAREAGKGHVRYLTYPSLLNRQEIPIMVYTPPAYAGGTERYLVVYNLHGAGGGSPARQWDRTYKTLTGAIEAGQVRPVIYVFVNGLGDTFFIDYEDGSVKAESTIVKELIPFIDAEYRTIASREGRAVDGFSMGGCGALMLALRNPDLFSSAVSYGAALIRGETIKFESEPRGRWKTRQHFDRFSPWALVQRDPERIRQTLRIRMVCGDKDGLFDANVQFKALLNELNIPVDWVAVPGVAHDTKGLYDRTGIEGLRFMFRQN